MSKFEDALKQRLRRNISREFDQRFWARFDQLFQPVVEWRSFLFTGLQVASVALFFINVVPSPKELSVSPSVALEILNEDLTLDLASSEGVDYLELNQEEWEILLEGKDV